MADMDNADSSKVARIIYRLEVSITQRLSDDPDDPDYPTLEGATSAGYRRRLERDVQDLLYKLKHYDRRIDVELMDYTVEEAK